MFNHSNVGKYTSPMDGEGWLVSEVKPQVSKWGPGLSADLLIGVVA